MTSEFPTATPRPWTVDMLEGGGWAVVVDADGEGAKVIAELDDTYGDRAANAALIVEAVNANRSDHLPARVRRRIRDGFEGEFGEQEALEAFAEAGWPGDWPDVVAAREALDVEGVPAIHPESVSALPLGVERLGGWLHMLGYGCKWTPEDDPHAMRCLTDHHQQARDAAEYARLQEQDRSEKGTGGAE